MAAKEQTTSSPTGWLKLWNDYLHRIVKPDYPFTEWKSWELPLFRFAFIFLLLLIIPLDWKFYKELFSINWLHLHFHDLLRLSKYLPQLFPQVVDGVPIFGAASYATWLVLLVLAVVGSFLWGKLDQTSREYTVLYYWLRVAVRYRLAIALVTYGFFKFFPLQMPYPSLSNLLTNYGDYYAWKIYFQTVGIAPNYESFLGFVEILAAFLIFYRRTVTFGVGLVIGFLGNVAVANGFYEIGEQVFSSYLVLLAAFLFVADVPRLWNLLVSEKYTYANKLIPDFSDATLKKIREIARYSFIFFTLLYAFKTYDSWANDPYKIPKTPGLKDAYGYYNVKEFIINKDTIPYSKTDKRRWQDVVFEKWSTLTIKQNRPVIIDNTNAEAYHEKDIERNYELAGYAGRHYFFYEADTIKQTLSLQNKNIHHRTETLQLHYERPNDSTIVLNGIDYNKDSITVVLNKFNKKYMMFEGRRKPVKL
jgi:hypothetical protein